jgi:hypothetical protein
MSIKDLFVRHYYIILLAFLLNACSFSYHSSQKIDDLKILPQNIEAYLDNLEIRDETYQLASLEAYKANYFIPWHENSMRTSLQDAQWAYRIFSEKNSYGENLLPLSQNYFKKIKQKSNFEEYATLNKKAITIVHTDIRAFPTRKPLFLNPKKAGEGFPFDYLQNSSIAPNKPLFVSHYSKDKEWVFVESSFAYGWLPLRDIAFISQVSAQTYEQKAKIFVTHEGDPLYDENNNFLFRTQIGMLLSQADAANTKKDKIALSLFFAKQNRNAQAVVSFIENEKISQGVLAFNQKNIRKIFHEVSQVKYGWGGLYKNRDCSSILRDFFAPFGLWLPRNSYQQSKVGKVISFKSLTDEQKIALIKQKAIPFETLLYKKGHILLYVGIKDGEVIVFHNAWGIKIQEQGREGRFLIAKPIFSTLTVGKNLKNYDKNASLLHTLKSMNILSHPQAKR